MHVHSFEDTDLHNALNQIHVSVGTLLHLLCMVEIKINLDIITIHFGDTSPQPSGTMVMKKGQLSAQNEKGKSSSYVFVSLK